MHPRCRPSVQLARPISPELRANACFFKFNLHVLTIFPYTLDDTLRKSDLSALAQTFHLLVLAHDDSCLLCKKNAKNQSIKIIQLLKDFNQENTSKNRQIHNIPNTAVQSAQSVTRISLLFIQIVI
jgi:hypothetical protein